MDFAAFAQSLVRRWRGRPSALAVLCLTRSTHLLGRRIIGDFGRECLMPPAVDLLAWEQSGGIGRHGGTWSSPPGGGIYLTMVRAVADEERIRTLSLAVSVAVCGAVNRLLGPPADRCRLKWPNDLQVGRRKLGGILIDVISPAAAGAPPFTGRRHSSRKDCVPLAVLSLGINFGRDLAAFAAPHPTSVAAERTAGAPPALDAAARELADAVDEALARQVSPRQLVAEYRLLSLHRPGDEIHCRLDGERVRGTFLDFDRHGFLCLEVEGEERRISAGVIDDG